MGEYSNYDITQTGYNDYLDLQRLNDGYQGIEDGYPIDPPKTKNKLSLKQILQINEYRQKQLERQYMSNLGFSPIQDTGSLKGFDPSRGDDLRSTPFRYASPDIAVPYGESRYDKYVETSDDLYNLDDIRASHQSSVSKITGGLGKAAVIAGTTLIDNIVGSVAGVFNIGKQAVTGNIHGFGDVADAFIQNPVSRYLFSINEDAENWFPTYYTNEERNAHWYDIWYHASFIGDHFLKNTGYMLGSYFSSQALSVPLSKAFKVNESRNVFKNTALAVGAGEKTYNEVLQAYKSGKAIGNGAMVSKSLAQAAKNAKHADMYLKLASTAFGSIGESRMEAITNSDQWFEKNKIELDNNKQRELDGIQDAIAVENPDLFGLIATTDYEGNVTGYRRGIIDPEGYEREYKKREIDIKQKYDRALELLTKERIDYSNASFGINFILTYFENLNIFGDAIAGSWSKRSNFNRRIKRASDGLSKQRSINKPLDIGIGIVRGPGFEGLQEMAQSATAKHLDRRAAHRLNSYYGDIIDTDGLDYKEGTVGSMRNFLYSIKDTFSDADEWENFVLGAATALLPLPTRANVQGKVQYDKDGKPIQGSGKVQSKIVAGGELWESIRDARRKYKETGALVKALNDLESDDTRKNQLYDLVKKDRLNQLLQKALDEGDQKTYKDLEFEKLASTVMVYSDAGQMKYLKDFIDEVYTVETPEQIQAVRSMLTYTEKQGDKEVTKSLFDDMEDNEITEYFQDQKEKVLEKIEKFNNIYNNINELYGDFGEGLSPAYRKTLALNIMSIDDREQRIKDISGLLLESVKSYAEKIRNTLPKQVEGYDEAIQQLTDIYNLDIAFGEDGIILRLELKQHEFLSNRNKQFNELLAELDDINQAINEAQKEEKALDKERYGTFELVLNRIKQLTKSLNWVRGRRNMVANSRKDIDFYDDLNDLTSLLAEREMLYMDLALLSGMDGKEIFDHSMAVDILDMMSKYDEKENQRIYDEYKKSGILDTFGRDIQEIADVAKRNNDEQAAKELGLYAKYQDVFYNAPTLDMNLPNETKIFNDVIQIIRDNKNLTVDEIDTEIQKYLDTLTDDEDINEIKNIISRRLKEKKKLEKDAEDAKKAVEHEDEEKSDEGDGKKIQKKFFSKSEEEFSEYLNSFDNAEDFKNELREQGIFDAIDGAMMYFTGTGIDDLGDDYETIKEALITSRQAAYDEDYFAEEEPEEETEESEEEPEEETPKKESKKKHVEKLVETDAHEEGDGIVTGTGSRVTFEDEDDTLSPDPNVVVVGELQGSQDLSDKEISRRNKGKDKDAVQEEKDNGNSQDYVEKRKNHRKTDAWDVNRYGIWSTSGLRRNALEPFEPTESDLEHKGNNISTVYSNLVRQAKCQEFIDNGLLERVLRYFDKIDSTGKRKRIRFVAIMDKDLIGDSYEAVNFVKNRIPLAAIELSQKDIENIIKDEQDPRMRQLLQERFENNTNLIQFNGLQGVKTFQILGVVTPEGFNSKGGTYLDENVGDTKYKKFNDSDYQTFIEEFKKSVEQKPAGKVEYNVNGGTRNFGYYKYSDFTSEVEYIYTGRLIKENDSKKSNEEVYLGDILTDSQLENPEGHLQVSVLFDNSVDPNDPQDRSHLDFGRRLGGKVIPLNTNFFENTVRQEAGQVRKGTVWILTKEADGNVYYKGCRVQSFTRDWWNENKDNQNNFYVRNIRRILENLAKNYSDTDEVKKNLNKLQELIYTDENHSIFVGKNGVFRVGKGRDNQISIAELSTEESVNKMLELMFNTNPGGYRFSLTYTSPTGAKLSLKNIIDSNILKTDLAQLHNTGASFAISKLAKQETGEFEAVPSETFKVIRTQGYRHTGTIGQDPNRNTVDLVLGDDTLTVKKEKGELEYYLNGKKVPKKQRNYYKGLYDTYVKAFNYSDREKNSFFRFRGSGLYAYEFNTSLNDDRTYGVVFSTNQDHKHYRLSQDEMMLLKKAKRQKDSLTKKEAKNLIKLFDKIGAKHYKWMDEDASVKEGERNPSVDHEEQIEKGRKVLQERYGKDYPNIGDTVSYVVVEIGPDGKKQVGDVITATIVGYNDKTSSPVLDNGQNISKGELDLFYGLSRSKPLMAENTGRYRQVLTKNNIQTQFNVEDEFEGQKKQIKVSKIILPSHASSMRDQLKDKNSKWNYYINDATRKTKDGIKFVGHAWNSTLVPAINFAVDSGLLDESFRIPYDVSSVELAEKAIKAVLILEDFVDSPSKLVDFVAEKQKQQQLVLKEEKPSRRSRRNKGQGSGTTSTVGGASTQSDEDPTGVFNYGNRTLMQQKLGQFWMQHKNQIADIVKNSGKQGKFFDLIVQSSSKALKEELLAKMQDQAWNREDSNKLLDLIRDIIQCK